jgi:hypothetical protein
MSLVLAINSGSSSLRFALFGGIVPLSAYIFLSDAQRAMVLPGDSSRRSRGENPPVIDRAHFLMTGVVPRIL